MTTMPKGLNFTFEIDGKKFVLETLEQGCEASTFKITSENMKSIIFKNFLTTDSRSKTGIPFAPYGLYGNLGILREANLAKVCDVPKLYLANPILKPIKQIFEQEKSYLGGWMLVEDVSTKTAPKTGLKFLDWLKEKGLSSADSAKEGNVLNGYHVDTGYIFPPNWRYLFLSQNPANYYINNTYSNYVANKTTDEILKLFEK